GTQSDGRGPGRPGRRQRPGRGTVRRRGREHPGEHRRRRRRPRRPEPASFGPRQHRRDRRRPAGRPPRRLPRAHGGALGGQGDARGTLGDDGARARRPAADVPRRLPRRRARKVRGRDRAGGYREQAGLGDGDHRGAGAGARKDRRLDPLHLSRLRLPGRRQHAAHPPGGALRGLPEGSQDAHRRGQDNGRARHRPSLPRPTGRLRAGEREPPRLRHHPALRDVHGQDQKRGPRGRGRRQDPGHLRRQGHHGTSPGPARRRRQNGRHPRCPRSHRVRPRLRQPRGLRRQVRPPPRPAGHGREHKTLRRPPARAARRDDRRRPAHRHRRPRQRPDLQGNRPHPRAGAAARGRRRRATRPRGPDRLFGRRGFYRGVDGCREGRSSGGELRV
ncbi:MAG: Phosphopentomutase, partial [uncultured Rubrobacteraceae bacterium]